jgi:hypothetical protein
MFPNHGVEDFKEMVGNAFTRGTVNDEKLDETIGFPLFHIIKMGIFGADGTGVVEVLVNPFLEVTKFAKVDYEAVGIKFSGGKGELDRPIVAMNAGTMTFVERLAMAEGNIPVCFGASKHQKSEVGDQGVEVSFQLFAIISAIEGASDW